MPETEGGDGDIAQREDGHGKTIGRTVFTVHDS